MTHRRDTAYCRSLRGRVGTGIQSSNNAGIDVIDPDVVLVGEEPLHSYEDGAVERFSSGPQFRSALSKVVPDA
jgi:hypothetical protein